MKFKNDTLLREWNSVKLAPRLHDLARAVDAFCKFTWGKDLFVTSIHRPGNPRSVHAYWRGLDARTKGYWNEAQIERIMRFVTENFPYGKAGFVSARYEVKGEVAGTSAATEDHLHLQVRA